MKSKDEKPDAPLKAYYAAPRTKFGELLDVSEWSLVDKIVLCASIPLLLANISLFIIVEFVITNNWIADGIAGISSWLMALVHAWLCTKKKGPNQESLPKPSHLWLALAWSFLATVMTVFWLVEHL